MTKQRASAYYKVRLRREHPVIYAELGPGKKYKTVRQAAAAAGLIHLPTRLDALKREWKKASRASADLNESAGIPESALR